MNEKINLTKTDGTAIQADLICFLEVVATGRRFVFYTLNEVMGNDANATVKIYVAKIKQDNPALDTPMTGDEWQLFTKTVMKSTIQSVPCNEVKYVPLTELVNPVSISEKAIAMPVFHDYINKQRGLYAQNVATLGSEPSATPLTETSGVQSADAAATTLVAPDTLVAQTTAEPLQSQVANTPNDTAENNSSFEIASESTNIFDNPLPPTPQPQNTLEVTPASEATTSATLEPQDTLTGNTPLATNSSSETSTSNVAALEPIDIASIEAKYEEMVASINKLKEQELEAAKRYNATIELSAMHKEQHASYVQNEQEKETSSSSIEPAPLMPSEPSLTEAPMINPFPSEPAPSLEQGNPAEPTLVTPVVPEPAPVTSTNLETNWFDMPNNQ